MGDYEDFDIEEVLGIMRQNWTTLFTQEETQTMMSMGGQSSMQVREMAEDMGLDITGMGRDLPYRYLLFYAELFFQVMSQDKHPTTSLPELQRASYAARYVLDRIFHGVDMLAHINHLDFDGEDTDDE